ncbi:MAG TPA: YncE family protein, partial [Planctomycetaceae bacterium]|nr:YncE family protein [Planctomycetaceae bacterium]
MRRICATAFLLGSCAALALLTSGQGPRADEAQPPPAPRFRGPVALLLNDGGNSLLAANRRSGSISVIDTGTGKVTDEFPIGKKLSGLVAVPERNLLLAADEEAHELITIARRGDSLEVISRLPIAEYPVSVAIGVEGKQCYVASLWSRRLSIVDLSQFSDGELSKGLRLSKVIALPFPPRKQLLVDGGRRLIIADGFGGKLAVIDVSSGELESVRELPAHNIRGLAVNADGSRLLIAHQILNSLARTTPDDVHWGM